MIRWSEEKIRLSQGEMQLLHNGLDKPPVLLLHGFSDSGRCWPRLAAALADDYAVIAPDQRGHGRTRMTGEDYSYERLAADAAELLDALGAGRAAVIGHSMGGMVALHLATAHPDRVRGVVFEDPAWWLPQANQPQSAPTKGTPQEHPAFRWLQGLQSQTPRLVREGCRLEHPDWAEVELSPWVDSKLQFDLSIFPHLPIAGAAAGRTAAWQRLLPELRCPALLLWGDDRTDAIVTAELAAAFEALTGHHAGWARHIPAAGHSLRRENFPAVWQEINAFLDMIHA